MSGDEPEKPARERQRHAGIVSDGLKCRSCGYELTGLDEHGNCPECGTPVAFSRRGDDLINADPAWLKLLARGGSIVLITACVWTGLALLRVILWVANDGTPSPAETYGEAITIVLGLANAAAFLVGLWWVTTARSDLESRPAVSLAMAARFVLIAGVVMSSASQLAQLGTASHTPVMIELAGVGVFS